MPPPGSAPHFNAGQDYAETAEPYYSNEDVAILHEIVVLAQELFPKLSDRERLPTNALFGAYYDVLSRVGVDTDHDNRYARVLFKIGGQRGPATLYEKFEGVLAKMGIEIEFDQDFQKDGQQYSQPENSTAGINGAGIGKMCATRDDGDVHQAQRRNSESSAWDLGINLRSQPTTRRNSFSTIGKDHSRVVIEEEFFQRGQQVPPAAKENNAKSTAIPETEDTNHGFGAWLNANRGKPRRTSGGSVSAHRSMRFRRLSISRDHVDQHYRPTTPSIAQSEYDLSTSEITAATSTFEEEIVPNWTQALVHRPAPKPEDLLMIKATLFHQARLQFLAKTQLETWKDRARDVQQDNRGLILIAIDHDQKALSRSAFDSWRYAFLQKRKCADLETFQARCEQQAWDSRGNFLLQTSFYHWIHVTNFHLRRTALARRLVVSNRVLNAWKDITAVNELKVRRQVLTKFFGAWKRHRVTVEKECTYAVQIYEGNLVEKVYRLWMWTLWEMRAAKCRADIMKRRALFRWIVTSHNNWGILNSAEDIRRLDLALNVWKMWRTTLQGQGRRGPEADEHYRKKLLLSYLNKWRKETRIVPAKSTVQSRAAVATLRGTFKIWRHRASQEKEAANLDRMKILKEALSVLRYKHLSTLVATRIDHRVLAEALLTMRLREAGIAFRRRQALTQCRTIFNLWKQRMEFNRKWRWEQESLARSAIIHKTKSDVLQTWRFHTESKQRLKTAALAYRNPRLLQSLVKTWSARSQHIQELDRRSQDANYYVVLAKTIKRWKSSAGSSRRDKRKAAYAQLRRMSKINLVRGVFHSWRDQARHAMSLHSQAAELTRNKSVILGMDVFDHWRARAEEIIELDSLWRENVLQKHFAAWESRSAAVQALETEAVLNYQEHRESRAVKQWSLLALKVKAQVSYATSIREKNAKKNFRKIFSYWRQKAFQKRPGKTTVFAESTPSNTKAKAEIWSEFEEDLEMDKWADGLDETGAVSTPLPGYLSTPSKRSERVLAVAARFSTTPKAPLSAPFERQLRAQWSGGVPYLRKPLTRSTLGADDGFGDIPENGLNNDDET